LGESANTRKKITNKFGHTTDPVFHHLANKKRNLKTYKLPFTQRIQDLIYEYIKDEKGTLKATEYDNYENIAGSV
jgi:hypothetical protein